MSARVGVVLFPGTNCELDVAYALEQLGASPEIVFHRETHLHGADAVVVPGGFAHGDYLRTGALARFSPVMDAVAEFAAAGGPVVGHLQRLPGAHRGRACCPGALQKNAGLKFLCETVECRVESTPIGADERGARPAHVLRLPINHFEGNYICDDATLGAAARRRPGRRCATSTTRTAASTTSRASATRRGNVVGLMPHPERASDACSARPTASCCCGRCCTPAAVVSSPRVIPAFFSTSAPTPSSRHVAYAMPLRVAVRTGDLDELLPRPSTGRRPRPFRRARTRGRAAPGRAAAASARSPSARLFSMAASRFLTESVVRLPAPPGLGCARGRRGTPCTARPSFAARGQRLLVLGGHALRCHASISSAVRTHRTPSRRHEVDAQFGPTEIVLIRTTVHLPIIESPERIPVWSLGRRLEPPGSTRRAGRSAGARPGADLHRQLGMTDDELAAIVELLGRGPDRPRARDVRGDVVGALLLQVVARASRPLPDRGAVGARRARARARASSTSATGSRSRSASRATTTRRRSSPTRARRPASAASSATSSRWARARSR